MRPLWYEFPEDDGSYGINDQYLLGPKYLVAPVSVQNVSRPPAYFGTLSLLPHTAHSLRFES